MHDVPAGARAGLTSITRGTVVMMLGTVGFVIENFVFRVLLIRTLSPEEWGQFFVGLTLVGLLAAVGSLGLPQAIARTLPFEVDLGERRRALRTGLAVILPSAVVGSVALAAASAPLGAALGTPLLSQTLLFFSAAVGLTIVATFLAAVFQGFEDAIPNALFLQVLNPAMFIGFLLLIEGVVPLHVAFSAALAAYTLSGVVTLGVLLVYARRRLPRLLPAGSSPSGLSGGLLRFAAPLLVVSVLTYVAGNLDALVLEVFRRPSVAFYSADLSMARLLQVGLGALSFIILPVTARFVRANDTASAKTTYATATKWMVLTSLPLFLIFFLYPGRSLAFVYTHGYAGTTTPLRLALTGAFLATVVGPSTSVQVSYGQTRLVLYNTLAAAVVDVTLSVALIPSLGISGAAIAWATATAVGPALSVTELALSTGVHPFRRHYLVPLAATGLPVGLGLGLLNLTPPLWALPLIVLGVAGVFVAVVLASRSLDAGDLMLLEAVEGLVGTRLERLRRLGRWFLRDGAPLEGP